MSFSAKLDTLVTAVTDYANTACTPIVITGVSSQSSDEVWTSVVTAPRKDVTTVVEALKKIRDVGRAAGLDSAYVNTGLCVRRDRYTGELADAVNSFCNSFNWVTVSRDTEHWIVFDPLVTSTVKVQSINYGVDDREADDIGQGGVLTGLVLLQWRS